MSSKLGHKSVFIISTLFEELYCTMCRFEYKKNLQERLEEVCKFSDENKWQFYAYYNIVYLDMWLKTLYYFVLLILPYIILGHFDFPYFDVGIIELKVPRYFCFLNV